MQCFLLRFVQCQQVFENDYNGINTTQINDPTVLNEFTDLVYQRLSRATSDLINSEIAQRATFCVTDPQDDWNRSFNFSSNLDFVSKCIVTTQGDLPQRLCTAAELKFYFSNFLANKKSKSTSSKYNRNCNLTTWVSGCEPGWACRSGLAQPVNFKDSREIPARTSNCQPCCEGFFCPWGLTCMIPCPLGSYCPLATFNGITGSCDPYSYQLPPGMPNHTCGGANIWADVNRGSSMFCSAGSYCPTNTQEIPCQSGHYCRMGSTAETRCFSLTSCRSNTTRQNITQYGLMLIVGISVLLFIFYNCYGQVIVIKERRYARSREVAVRSVKENAQAQARWLAAKEAIKKKAIELQSQVSRSFSHRTNDQVEEYHDSSESVSQETADKDNKKILNVKHIRTDSQIFRYAYSQLEREKAQQQQNRDLTFSGVVAMATAMNNEIKKRPPIEIAFSNLTVTLKQKKKHILRCVTGEIRPGRITALMGPSGAGKTTLLSALAGKTVGCSINGLVLVNGTMESIRSYKKIVGFVPQDDIVHGNLTVEENIWFSANCRLSADLPKADKVLIVERVIESLGLQPVRDSLVGTVENRGISGGQRKRVNVGLELVMEPSLLFLDEPTSGLDSSSSQLLLRALRREALEGVNICTVVHQPR
ncbi:hypothetical protein RD792_017967 [Penstemon davidsonii]|uniref:ABC transporter domain-containing protein n=1 Tax=Penstemon davidsonii TaxID=160366 RepID=A0ABR0DVC3_9LAMI|nr:hypothetical protein RD792_017967 [Penstemon davidsonii]